METETAQAITGIQRDIKEICKDQSEMKQDLKDLKSIYASLERFNILESEVKEIKSNLSKVVWAIILAVLGAVLSLVIRGI